MTSTIPLKRLNTEADLDALKAQVLPRLALRTDPGAQPCEGVTHNIMICCDTGCTSSGARVIVEAFEKDLAAKGLAKSAEIVVIGCHGFCEMGPLIIVYPNDVYYVHLKPEDIPEIVDETIIGGRPVEKFLYHDRETAKPIVKYKEIEFYAKQNRILLTNCGQIHPERVTEYIARDGYKALAKALSMRGNTDALLEEVKLSGLRGRGGGGFPTGRKW